MSISQPIETPRNSRPGEAPRKSQPVEAPRKFILFVDDDEGMRAAIYDAFSPQYRVAMAVDGIEGYSRAIELQPDLIITDIAMPRLDGVAMVRRLQENEALRVVPVIFLTGQLSPTSLIVGLPTGVPFAHLPKSAHPYVLKKKVQSALGDA